MNEMEKAKELAELMEKLPAAPETKTGYWKLWLPGDCGLILTGEEHLWECSNCGAKYAEKQALCPYCKSLMYVPVCKWKDDWFGVCCNEKSPVCADNCPYSEGKDECDCRFFEEGEREE